jgi:hypothetical protein
MEKKRIIGIVLALIGVGLILTSIILSQLMPSLVNELILLTLLGGSIVSIALGLVLIVKGGVMVDVDYSAADGEEDRIEEIMEDIDEDNELIK